MSQSMIAAFLQKNRNSFRRNIFGKMEEKWMTGNTRYVGIFPHNKKKYLKSFFKTPLEL